MDPRFTAALESLRETVERNPHLSWGQTPERCQVESPLGLGCARSHAHSGAHWFTGNPEAARADLVRQGIRG